MWATVSNSILRRRASNVYLLINEPLSVLHQLILFYSLINEVLTNLIFVI